MNINEYVLTDIASTSLVTITRIAKRLVRPEKGVDILSWKSFKERHVSDIVAMRIIVSIYEFINVGGERKIPTESRQFGIAGEQRSAPQEIRLLPSSGRC